MSYKVTKDLEGDGIFEVRVSPQKIWFSLVLVPPILVVWTAVGGWLVVKILSGDPPDNGSETVEYIVWPLFWLLSISFLGYGWLWNAFGGETITVSDGSFVVRISVLRLGRSRSFRISEVSDFCNGGLDGGGLEFDARSRTYRLRSHLGTQEAREVARLVNQHLL